MAVGVANGNEITLDIPASGGTVTVAKGKVIANDPVGTAVSSVLAIV